MKGPGLRIDLDVRRMWRCPRCQRVARTPGNVVSQSCGCAPERVWMVLQQPLPRPRFVPDYRELEAVEDYTLEPDSTFILDGDHSDVVVEGEIVTTETAVPPASPVAPESRRVRPPRRDRKGPPPRRPGGDRRPDSGRDRKPTPSPPPPPPAPSEVPLPIAHPPTDVPTSLPAEPARDSAGTEAPNATSAPPRERRRRNRRRGSDRQRDTPGQTPGPETGADATESFGDGIVSDS